MNAIKFGLILIYNKLQCTTEEISILATAVILNEVLGCQTQF
jgi:hypothetical protein